jgi:hypothetical protein
MEVASWVAPPISSKLEEIKPKKKPGKQASKQATTI